MKRIIIGFLFLILTSTAMAKETVTIVYSWTPADGPANYSRAIIDEANRLQNKYTFIFEAKPGAGGSIAANHVRNTPNTILATASAFFVRPNFFPNESYDLNSFREIYLQCTAPMAITAIKYQTWADVPRNQPITIGVSGLGTTTHLFAAQIQKKYPNLTVVPFKSTSESLLSVAAGNTDLHVAFLGEVENWGATNSKFKKLNVLGISGTKSIQGFPTLVGQGFSGTIGKIEVPFHLAVPSNLDDKKFAEWRNILVTAGKSTSVKKFYEQDACVDGNLEDVNLVPWYRMQVEKWRHLSTGVNLAQ